MKTIKRLATTISASFDQFVNQVENQEAIVTGAIEEAQEAFGRARVQLARVIKNGENMKTRLNELEIKVKQWEERAINTHEKDREKAIQCLSRKKMAEAEITQLQENIKKQTALELNLKKDLNSIQVKIEGLKQKRDNYAARQNRCDAIRVLDSQDSIALNDIDSVFERWDMKLGRYEITGVIPDDLEDEFIKDEEKQDLEFALEELLKNKN